MYEKLLQLWDKLEGPLGIEIKSYVDDIKVKELLDKIPEKEDLKKQFEVFKDLDEFKLDDIRDRYQKVIPLISKSGKVPHPSISKYVEYFQDQSLQAADKRQEEMIQKLEKRIDDQQKQIDQLKNLIRELQIKQDPSSQDYD